MSMTEILVLVGGLVLGYWVVSKLIDDLNRDQKNPLGQQSSQESAVDGAPRPWHEVLKVSPDATADEIRQSYQALLARHQPDEAAITAAYREAMQSRGKAA